MLLGTIERSKHQGNNADAEAELSSHMQTATVTCLKQEWRSGRGRAYERGPKRKKRAASPECETMVCQVYPPCGM